MISKELKMVSIPECQLIKANNLLNKIHKKIKDWEWDTYCMNGIGGDTDIEKNIKKLKECITITV